MKILKNTSCYTTVCIFSLFFFSSAIFSSQRSSSAQTEPVPLPERCLCAARPMTRCERAWSTCACATGVAVGGFFMGAFAVEHFCAAHAAVIAKDALYGCASVCVGAGCVGAGCAHVNNGRNCRNDKKCCRFDCLDDCFGENDRAEPRVSGISSAQAQPALGTVRSAAQPPIMPRMQTAMPLPEQIAMAAYPLPLVNLDEVADPSRRRNPYMNSGGLARRAPQRGYPSASVPPVMRRKNLLNGLTFQERAQIEAFREATQKMFEVKPSEDQLR